MSDDRLFVSNNPIGKKGYFINLIILGIIIFLTNFCFTNYVFPHTKTNEYNLIAQIIMYFLYLVYIITLLSLIDRRIYDITGDRNSSKYKLLSKVVSLLLLYEIIVFILNFYFANLPINFNILNFIGVIFFFIFSLITIILVFFKGKISEQTYKEYQNRKKYQQ